MLTLSKPLSSSQAKTYHNLEFTAESQSYYKQGGTVVGEWQGQLAETFGLSGAVEAEQFGRLAEGLHPYSEHQLVRHRPAQEYAAADGETVQTVEHRAGWDATFSAPKSVSLTALVGGDDRVREAHRAAVTTALSELERYTQARIGGNHSAETTGRFIAAKFEHDTARPVDGYAAPQLHTHAVIFNVTERADGSTRALQPASLFDSQTYATAVYQSALTYQLRQIGYEIEPGRSGAPEIKGYSQEYLDASSLRSQQIKQHLEQSGHSSPAAAQIAAHATRDSKQILTPEEVLRAHKELATEYGNQADAVIAEARLRIQTQQQMPDGVAVARHALAYARSSNFEREAVADERVLMRDALRRGMGEATYAQVRQEFESRAQRGDLHELHTSKHATARSFTTPETMAEERANVRHVLSTQQQLPPIAGEGNAQQRARSRAFLNEAQRTAITEVLTTTDRIHGLQGLAGTGKTTTLAAIREGAQQNGYAVEGFAPTSRAAGQLREAGVNASTLQSFIARGSRDQAGDFTSRHLYMLDESSLASTRQMRAFLDKLQSQDRVLVIGDTGQHQGVDAGKPFEQMQAAGMRTSHLDQIVRQRDPELLKAVEHLAQGETAVGIAMLAQQGRITEVRGVEERIRAIAADYAAKPQDTIIVSPDNRGRQEINQAVRLELAAKGTLGTDHHTFETLTHRADMTGPDRAWAARYQPGNVVEYTTGSKELGLARNSTATVLSTNARENTVTVVRLDGESVTYNPRRLRGVNVYQATEREFATGDRLQFTAADRAQRVHRRDLGTITQLTPNRINVQLDGPSPRSVSFDPAQFRTFDHGYAVTSYSAQGLTTGRVIANIDTDGPRALINTRLAYVAISRAAEDARVYTNDASVLGDKLAREHSKTTAIEFRREDAGPRKPNAGAHIEQERVIHQYAHPEHRLAAVLADYAAHPGRAVVIAPDAGERREINKLIRSDLQQQGLLSSESRSVPILVEQTIAVPKLAASYTPGDQIHYRTGSPELTGIPHNSVATVVASDAKSNRLTVERNDGERITYAPHEVRAITRDSRVFREESRELAVGDRIQITSDHKEQRLRTGDLVIVERLGENHSLTVRTDDARSVDLTPDQARHIEHGYAVAGGQRTSAERVIATGDAITTQDLAGVSPQSREVAVYKAPETPTHEQSTALNPDSAFAQAPPPQQQQHQEIGLGLAL